MRKPDLFDEILFYLKELSLTEKRISVDQKILDDLYSAGVTRKTPEDIPLYTPPAREAAAAVQSIEPVRVCDTSSASWEELENAVSRCSMCPLCSTRRHTVFGDGFRNARLMFIGEGPGADEDEQGLPFVGKAGELLTRMIGAMSFDRWKEVYIANTVKCRPPDNRQPLPAEAEACKGYLLRQVELVSPEVIVLLGATPLLYLMNIKGISRVRGTWLDFNGIKVMPTYHPAYLLRDPRKKVDVWRDLQLVMKEFGRLPAGKQ